MLRQAPQVQLLQLLCLVATRPLQEEAAKLLRLY